MYCSFVNFTMTSIIPLSKKSGKRFIKVVKTSRFALYGSKRCTQKTYMTSIWSSGEGNFLFLLARGLGIDLQERKEIANPQRECACGRGGGGASLQVNLNHALALHAIFSPFS